MLMSVSPSLYCRHRFPAEIIGQCVWLYFRFTLSHRDIEEMMAVRGVTHTYKGTGKSAPPAKGLVITHIFRSEHQPVSRSRTSLAAAAIRATRFAIQDHHHSCDQ